MVRTFDHYLNSSSDIVSGDMATLFLKTAARENPDPLSIDICCGPSLLAMEKEKNKSAGIQTLPDFFPVKRENDFRIGSCAANWPEPGIDNYTRITITATMVSDYFFYSQCNRRFCLKLTDHVSPGPDLGEDTELRSHFLNQGILHEKAVIQELKNQGASLLAMETMGSKKFRFGCFIDNLKQAVISNGKPGLPFFFCTRSAQG